MRVNLLVGRFQPFTLGHMKCVEYAYEKTGLPTVIACISTSKRDAKHPFSDQLMKSVMNKLIDGKLVVDVIWIKTANIVEIGEMLTPKYEIASWTCGTDRYSAYNRMATNYHDKAHLTDDFKLLEVVRGDEDISATKVRSALRQDDEREFKSMTPKSLHSMYRRLRDEILEIKESLSEYISRLIYG